MEDDQLQLSRAALDALKEFALERGLDLESEEEEDEQIDFRKRIEKALDSEPREDLFTFRFGDEDNQLVIQLEGLRRDLGQTLDSTGLTLWRAGDFLSDFIYRNRHIFENNSVLELGSGLGLCGILVSHFADRVVITDGDDSTISLLEKNCKLNDVDMTKVQCRKLWWGDHKNFCEDKFDIIFGADIIYEAESVAPLFGSASHFLKRENPKAVFLLAYTKRNVKIDYVLETADRVGFEWEEPTTDEGIYTFRFRAD